MRIPILLKYSRYSTTVLQVGLGLVLLWFGAQQLMDPSAWAIWVPNWVLSFGIGETTIVVVNGVVEVLSGICLMLGIFVQPLALLMALHLVPVAINLGFDAIAVRDFGLIMAFIALALRPDEQS